MNNKQLLRIFKEIDGLVESFTLDGLYKALEKSELYSILEKAINEVLWDKESIDHFWNTYQSTAYDGTPKEHCIDYMIIDSYFESKLNAHFRKLLLDEAAKVTMDLKRDAIMNVGEDSIWVDYALKIQDIVG
jgi:hypothetical protein